MPGMLEAGCDEAGRGCLAGPVFAAAVILPDDFTHPWLNDSKQLSEARRMELRPLIQWQAVAWAVATASPQEIDDINILNASILAMHRALDALQTRPRTIAVDGNRFKPYRDIPHTTYVKGDGRFADIAAASVLAKTFRDEYMLEAAAEYPGYDWENNKGYPTEAHRRAVAELGLTPLHRRSFRMK
ncbi:MAG: ribonuclease HII [Muribaculaceae bacterium]|nr:ribonuclease HII [Muribaculaceae bacterium]MDE5929235.1 ribonuclease HII [Muribaculaceae bacterium]